MARHDEEREDGKRRPALSRRDTWRLVLATYFTSLPYLLIFVIAMLAATWFVTTVLFR
jgi:hypothetical protein